MKITGPRPTWSSSTSGASNTMTPPSYYLPRKPQKARAGLDLIAPILLGADPRNHRARMEEVAFAIRGYKPTKSVIDMALWDLVGTARCLPLVDLCDEQLAEIADFRAQGYKLFQIKLGDHSPREEIARIRACQGDIREGERCWFDANRAWIIDQAMRIIPLCRDIAPLFKQPCEPYEVCLRVLARHTGMGLMLNDAIEDQPSFIRAARNGIINVAVLKKMGSTGGISQRRHLTELAYVSASACASKSSTAQACLAESPISLGPAGGGLLPPVDYHLPEVQVVKNPFEVVDGSRQGSRRCGPGLGVVDLDVLGYPIMEWCA